MRCSFRYFVAALLLPILMLLFPTPAFAQYKDNPFNESFGSSAQLTQVLSTRAAEFNVSALSLTILNKEGDIVSAHAGETISDQFLFQAHLCLSLSQPLLSYF